MGSGRADLPGVVHRRNRRILVHECCPVPFLVSAARRRSGVGRGRAVLDGAARGVPDPGRRVADRADPDRRRHRVPHHGGGEIPCCTPQAGARSRGETVGGAPTPNRKRSRSSAERRAALLAGARPRARARRVRPGRTTPASCGPARATVSVRAGSRVAVGCGIAFGLCHVITLRAAGWAVSCAVRGCRVRTGPSAGAQTPGRARGSRRAPNRCATPGPVCSRTSRAPGC